MHMPACHDGHLTIVHCVPSADVPSGLYFCIGSILDGDIRKARLPMWLHRVCRGCLSHTALAALAGPDGCLHTIPASLKGTLALMVGSQHCNARVHIAPMPGSGHSNFAMPLHLHDSIVVIMETEGCLVIAEQACGLMYGEASLRMHRRLPGQQAALAAVKPYRCLVCSMAQTAVRLLPGNS